jgi:glycosyltransferase involved in cell wall biosynthesis
MVEMKLSVLLVTYNQEKYIDECLDGILMQDVDFEWELVVADDCSTDNTLSILKKRLSSSRISCVYLNSKSNIGVSKNYERGFASCHGEYIAVIEGDDYWTDPNRIKKHVAFLDMHRECVMSFNRKVVFNEEWRRFSVVKWDAPEDYQYVTTRKLIMGNCIGNLSTCVFRRSVIEKLKPGLFDIGVADWMLGMAVGQFGLLARLKEVMSVYRVHSGGVWSGRSSKEQRKRLVKKIDMYNHYLDYRFDKEFRLARKRIRLKLMGLPKFLIYIYMKSYVIFSRLIIRFFG